MIESQSRKSSIVEAVMKRSHGRWERQIVVGLVNESLVTFDNAPVQQFVELLVGKEVTDELRRIEANPTER
jgi:hypothetical protein